MRKRLREYKRRRAEEKKRRRANDREYKAGLKRKNETAMEVALQKSPWRREVNNVRVKPKKKPRFCGLRGTEALAMSEEYKRAALRVAPNHCLVTGEPVSRYGHSVSNLSSWKIRGKTAEAQFLSLAQHMLCKFQVPKFMLLAFVKFRDNYSLGYFVRLVARGESVFQSIRKAGLPYKLTRRMCHILMHIGGTRDLVRAIRMAQVIGLGGSRMLAQQLTCNALLDYNQDELALGIEDRILEAFAWFCKQRMLDPNSISHIVDFLTYKWRTGAYSLKGRTFNSVSRAVEEWQTELRQAKENSEFESCGIPDTKLKRRVSGDEEEWSFHEILNSKELAEEGKRQDHCVYSYKWGIETGRTSIFSVRLDGIRQLTMEINRSDRLMNVRQVAGRFNRPPNSIETRMIREWAAKYNVRCSRY